MPTQLAHIRDDPGFDGERWIVRVASADLTSWPAWRLRQLRRGLELVSKAIAGERELTQLEQFAKALQRMAVAQKPSHRLRWRSPRERLEAEIKADLDYGRD